MKLSLLDLSGLYRYVGIVLTDHSVILLAALSKFEEKGKVADVFMCSWSVIGITAPCMLRTYFLFSFFLIFYFLFLFIYFFFCSEFCHTLKWKGLGHIFFKIASIYVKNVISVNPFLNQICKVGNSIMSHLPTCNVFFGCKTIDST